MKEDIKGKVNKEELAERVADRLNSDSCGCDSRTVSSRETLDVINAVCDEIEDAVCEGEKVSLTGFGSFSAHTHKGHPVQFGSGETTVKDYRVFKFTPSNIVSKRLRGNNGHDG